MSDIQSVIHHSTMILRRDSNNRRLCPRPAGRRSFCLNYDSRDAGGADWMQSRQMVPSFPRKRESIPARARTAWRHGMAAPLLPAGIPSAVLLQQGPHRPPAQPTSPVNLALPVDVVGDAEQHRRPPLVRNLPSPTFDGLALDERQSALLAPPRVIPASL